MNLLDLPENTAETVGTMAVKAAPPVAVVSAHYFGMSIPDWVQLITLCYVSLMLAHKVWQVCWGAYKFWVLGRRDE